MWNQLCGIFMIVKKAEDHVSKRFSPFSQRPAILDLIIQTQVTIRTPSNFVPCDSHLGVCVKSDDVTWEKLEPNTGGYLILAYTSQVNSVFCAIWLVPLSWNILHYSPQSKTKWHPVLFLLRKKNFFRSTKPPCHTIPKKQRNLALKYSKLCISLTF